MSFTLANVEFSHAKGFFGQQSVAIPTDTLSLDLDFVNRLGGSVVFAEPKVELAIANSLGLPITLDLNVSSYDLSGTAQPLGIPPTLLPYPLTATQFGQTVQDSLTFDKSNTSIVDFFTLPKQRFTFGGQVQINADTLATGVQNFVTGTSAISADVNCTPMCFWLLTVSVVNCSLSSCAVSVAPSVTRARSGRRIRNVEPILAPSLAKESSY